MQRFPQELINVKDVAKERLNESSAISKAIEEKQSQLGDTGRILVRASGTESLVRVMVEAQSAQIAKQIAEEIAALVRSELS